MEAANMTFKEAALKSRVELRRLRLENARVTRSNEILRKKKVLLLETQNLQLKKENRLLKQNQMLLLKKQELQEQQIESLQLIVEELRRMVFGKKKTKDDSNNTTSGSTNTVDAVLEKETTKRKSANRSNESYRRVIPEDSAVTDTVDYPLSHCPDCGTLLTQLKK